MTYTLQISSAIVFILNGLVMACCGAEDDGAPPIVFWYGDTQLVGRSGIAQDDFNILGHVNHWQQIDALSWSINGRNDNPLSFRAYRRLARDGDFNIDLPIGMLRPGDNTVSVSARLRDGSSHQRSLTVVLVDGESRLPLKIDWAQVTEPQEVGDAVDGLWKIVGNQLRNQQIAYDRVFLVGERHWQDYEVRTSITIHKVAAETDRFSNAPGLGIIWRFSGHVVGGPRHFPSAQPKWGYQPFGAIGWLRWVDWNKGLENSPQLQFYSGASDKTINFGRFEVELGKPYAVRAMCQTLPDADDASGVTRYSFKIWPEDDSEPKSWSWQHTQTDQHALRRGGFALVAHHVEASFGPISATSPADALDAQLQSHGADSIALDTDTQSSTQ